MEIFTSALQLEKYKIWFFSGSGDIKSVKVIMETYTEFQIILQESNLKVRDTVQGIWACNACQAGGLDLIPKLNTKC